ncbi:hypothetical protein [Paralimibaculum aggregatum]|nr:hypothetical protein [Limibaculum sp. NKW23]
MKRAVRPTISLLATLGLAAALGAATAPPAQAQQMRCGPRAKIVAHLEKKYGETRHSVGLQQGRGLVEVYANADSGSWTILLTTPQGLSCLMAAGDAYQAMEASLADTPA